MKKIILVFSVIAIGAAAAFGYYLYNKPRAGVNGMKAEHVISAAALYEEYSGDENAANAKYLGKVLEVNGTVSSFSTDEHGILNVTLDSGSEMGVVNCQLLDADAGPLNPGSQVTIKGFCSGLLMDVVLVDCILVNKKS